MKRTVLLFALVALALVVVACAAPTPTPTPVPPTAVPKPTEAPKPTAAPTTAPPAAPDLKGRALKVGSDTTYPPFESINDKKEIVGFDVDLVNEICKKINCKPTFITADFDGLLIAVNNKTYDFSISGWTITDERAKTVDFGLPYMKNTQVLLVRTDETAIKEPEDLKKPEALVAVQLGTTNSITAKKLVADPNKQVKEFQDFPAAVQALINKQANVVVIDAFASSQLLEDNKGKIKLTGKQFGDEALGMVFRKGDTELKSAFDAGLKAVYADGTWGKLCEKWWKAISPKPDCTGAGLPLK
jgi:polar amino acid transport system substrate-binding protein